MRALKYDVTVNYVKGPDVQIADALTRVSPQLASANGQLPEIHVHHITQNLPVSPTRFFFFFFFFNLTQAVYFFDPINYFYNSNF